MQDGAITNSELQSPERRSHRSSFICISDLFIRKCFGHIENLAIHVLLIASFNHCCLLRIFWAEQKISLGIQGHGQPPRQTIQLIRYTGRLYFQNLAWKRAHGTTFLPSNIILSRSSSNHNTQKYASKSTGSFQGAVFMTAEMHLNIIELWCCMIPQGLLDMVPGMTFFVYFKILKTEQVYLPKLIIVGAILNASTFINTQEMMNRTCLITRAVSPSNAANQL